MVNCHSPATPRARSRRPASPAPATLATRSPAGARRWSIDEKTRSSRGVTTMASRPTSCAWTWRAAGLGSRRRHRRRRCGWRSRGHGTADGIAEPRGTVAPPTVYVPGLPSTVPSTMSGGPGSTTTTASKAAPIGWTSTRLPTCGKPIVAAAERARCRARRARAASRLSSIQRVSSRSTCSLQGVGAAMDGVQEYRHRVS